MDLPKLNMIIITLTGVMMALLGLILCFSASRSFLAENIRFFLPIPPLGVAAYVYVFNFCKKCLGASHVTPAVVIRDAVFAVLYATGIYLLFIVPLLFYVYMKEFR
jgi:hypothetical protein